MNTHRTIRNTLWMVLASGACLLPAQATTVRRLSLEQLTQASTAILRGHVVSQETRWNDAHTVIVTLTTMAVDQAIKGNPGVTVVIEQLGGTLGHLRVQVSGTVAFHSGDDYILFLEPAGSDSSNYLVVGLMQGSYRVYRDTASGEERVIRPFGGTFYKGGSGAEPAALSLAQFRQLLRAALAAPVDIPRGTVLPVVVDSSRSLGGGRRRVLGRTAMAAYPTEHSIIPSGSEVEGEARRMSGQWAIRWTDVSVRGTRVAMNAASNASAAGTLDGQKVIATVR